ncbi:MAG: transcriptional regulator [Rhizobiales bacterium 24-66-13]|nr:MAG: transcriptional regulator [Rhizobiales bacterium 24-66-13]OZB08441.1 MAG: transcriptional regulator [Rhizobiales bacterium 39-66-18]HQS48150.1 type II toxin-antitoxin system VapB family antitoxin [Xanthobacteraceae bacterium]
MSTLQIRDERARALAQQLATRRKITMTEAVIQALEGELKRDKDKEPLADRLKRIATALAAEGKPRRQTMTKDEVDTMWGR